MSIIITIIQLITNQPTRSGGGTVYIREANGKTTGKYKCEISIEGTFQTVAAEKLMTVFSKFYFIFSSFIEMNKNK